jgi:hypothetical protein
MKHKDGTTIYIHLTKPAKGQKNTFSFMLSGKKDTPYLDVNFGTTKINVPSVLDISEYIEKNIKSKRSCLAKLKHYITLKTKGIKKVDYSPYFNIFKQMLRDTGVPLNNDQMNSAIISTKTYGDQTRIFDTYLFNQLLGATTGNSILATIDGFLEEFVYLSNGIPVIKDTRGDRMNIFFNKLDPVAEKLSAEARAEKLKIQQNNFYNEMENVHKELTEVDIENIDANIYNVIDELLRFYQKLSIVDLTCENCTVMGRFRRMLSNSDGGIRVNKLGEITQVELLLLIQCHITLYLISFMYDIFMEYFNELDDLYKTSREDAYKKYLDIRKVYPDFEPRLIIWFYNIFSFAAEKEDNAEFINAFEVDVLYDELTGTTGEIIPLFFQINESTKKGKLKIKDFIKKYNSDLSIYDIKTQYINELRILNTNTKVFKPVSKFLEIINNNADYDKKFSINGAHDIKKVFDNLNDIYELAKKYQYGGSGSGSRRTKMDAQTGGSTIDVKQDVNAGYTTINEDIKLFNIYLQYFTNKPIVKALSEATTVIQLYTIIAHNPARPLEDLNDAERIQAIDMVTNFMISLDESIDYYRNFIAVDDEDGENIQYIGDEVLTNVINQPVENPNSILYGLLTNIPERMYKDYDTKVQVNFTNPETAPSYIKLGVLGQIEYMDETFKKTPISHILYFFGEDMKVQLQIKQQQKALRARADERIARDDPLQRKLQIPTAVAAAAADPMSTAVSNKVRPFKFVGTRPRRSQLRNRLRRGGNKTTRTRRKYKRNNKRIHKKSRRNRKKVGSKKHTRKYNKSNKPKYTRRRKTRENK